MMTNLYTPYRKWICQSFWTKPMRANIKNNINLAKISLYYAHRSGYYVKMYTDSVGYEYLKDLGYDSIVKDLDAIPSDISGTYFAYPKYIALKNEPIGVIHTDFDVFLKKPCIDIFYEDKSYDVILQQRECRIHTVRNEYAHARKFFKEHERPNGFHYEHPRASNVGVIGFNNKLAKNLYLGLYKKCIDFYKTRYQKYDFIPDLFFEQVNIDYLVKKYKFKTKYLLSDYGFWDMRLHREAVKIGFQHLIGGWKYSKDGIEYMNKFVDKLFSYKKTNIKIIWSAPCSGKSELAKKSDRYIDFDKAKEHNQLYHPKMVHTDYVEKLFKLFFETIKKYDNKDKILLVSDIELLHTFYRDFSDIYVLDISTMKDRIIKRKRDNEVDIDKWCNLIEDKINFIKQIRSVKKIDGYLTDELITGKKVKIIQ